MLSFAGALAEIGGLPFASSIIEIGELPFASSAIEIGELPFSGGTGDTVDPTLVFPTDGAN